MTAHNCHLIHVDDTKDTVIVGYVGNPTEELSHDTLMHHVTDAIDTQNKQSLFVNVIPLNRFGFRIAEQLAIVDFIANHSDHMHVKHFIHHFNTTEEDIAELFMDGGPEKARQYLIEQPIKLVEEILIDAMLEQVHA